MNNWPVDPPSMADPNPGPAIPPMLPPDGGYPENARDFAAKAFHLFGVKLFRKIEDVNEALRAYHKSAGEKDKYDKYCAAAQEYRNFLRHPVVRDGLDPGDPPPARVFAIEGLEVSIRTHGDYCVAVSFRGAVVFSAGGPSLKSSYSSSCYPPPRSPSRCPWP
jgi:hypothetical protein